MQVITFLNHMGVCVSYQGAWMYLTTESKCLEFVQSGHWLWVYDNLNLHQKVRHEREGMLGYMYNMHMLYYTLTQFQPT